jgi:hypothetical protein
VREIGAAQPLLPIAIRLDLVDEHSALLATVSAEIALTVAIDVESRDTAATLHGLLPDAGVYGPPAPLDVARKTNAHGD